MERSDDPKFLAGKRDGLATALQIVDERLGDEHLKGMQPEEFLAHLLEIAAAIRKEIDQVRPKPPG